MLESLYFYKLESLYFYTDDQKLKWSWLRSVEWGIWPLFITQPIVPILFIFFEWWHVIIAVIILTWLWAFIRYQFISLTLAWYGAYFVTIRWIVSIIVGLYFLSEKNLFLAIISGLYPMIIMVLKFFVPTTQVGILQDMFMDKLDKYKPFKLF